MQRIWLKYDYHVQDKATSYERLVLAVVTAWVQGQIEEVVDLHFQVCPSLCPHVLFKFYVNPLVRVVGEYSSQDHDSGFSV